MTARAYAVTVLAALLVGACAHIAGSPRAGIPERAAYLGQSASDRLYWIRIDGIISSLRRK